jgi:small subunit ribosomal protein S3
MGQKVHPIGFRLGINQNWFSNWFPKKNHKEFLQEDAKIRKFIEKELDFAGVAYIEIERTGNELKLVLLVARPGTVVGKKREGLEKLKKSLFKILKKEVIIEIKEVQRAETNAKLVAMNIAKQLEKRFPFRRVMKKAIQNSERYGVTGIKVMISGRLNGAEIARTEWLREGRVPLHTIKNKIDYATHEAKTIYGILGVKVWIYNTKKTEKKY